MNPAATRRGRGGRRCGGSCGQRWGRHPFIRPPFAILASVQHGRSLYRSMAFECVHCKSVIEDDSLKVPRSGVLCPNCKKDPTEGWSPYLPDVAEAGRRVAEEMRLRLMVHDWGVQEAALFFLEDMMLEQRHE